MTTTMMMIMMMVKFMQSALSEFDNCYHHYCQAGAHDIIGQEDICHGDVIDYEGPEIMSTGSIA